MKTTYKHDKVHTTVAVGVFSAFAFVCTVIFHFKAAFLSFDLKDAVMTVGAMIFGPIYGLAMSVIVSLAEMLTISNTGPYGLIMNILSSVTFVCVGSFIYSRKRTLGGAAVGMAASVAAMVAVMLGANLIITPFYTGMTASEVAKMIPTLLLPFNLTKGLFNASLVFLIYKPVSAAGSRAGFASVTTGAGGDAPIAVITKPDKKDGKRTDISSVVIIVALAVAVLCLVFFFLKLGGSVTVGK